MFLKKIRKRNDNLLAWAIIRASALIVRNLSLKQAYGFACGAGTLFYHTLSKHRRTALESLAVAFGQEKTAAERIRICRRCFELMALSAVELVFYLGRTDLLKQNISIANKQYLDDALAKGRGVILVTAHFGNFVSLLARLSVEGYKTAVIMRPLKNGKPEKLFEAERRKLDIETILSIPRRQCVVQAIRSLRNKKALLIPLDQNFGTGGVFVRFFGHPAATATGPVVLAQRTGAVILPCFIVRDQSQRQTVVFEPPVELVRGKDEQDTIRRNIQTITDLIESYIRRYPEHWSWIHRRWKAKPRQ